LVTSSEYTCAPLAAGPDGRIGVHAQEQVRLVVVRERRAPIDGERLVTVARQEHPNSQTALNRRPSASRATEAPGLSPSVPGRALHALVVTAMARVDDDRLDARDYLDLRSRTLPAAAGSQVLKLAAVAAARRAPAAAAQSWRLPACRRP
jgi:hypothetical protein